MRAKLTFTMLAVALCLGAAADNLAGIAVTHTPGNYTPGATVEIQVTITQATQDQLSALGLRETLPTGWSYAGKRAISGGLPAVSPDLNSTGTLEFAWIDVPSFPYTFAFSLNAPADATGDVSVTGQVEYRIAGPQQLSSPETYTVSQPSSGDTCDIGQQGFFGWLICVIVSFFRSLFGIG